MLQLLDSSLNRTKKLVDIFNWCFVSIYYCVPITEFDFQSYEKAFGFCMDAYLLLY